MKFMSAFVCLLARTVILLFYMLLKTTEKYPPVSKHNSAFSRNHRTSRLLTCKRSTSVYMTINIICITHLFLVVVFTIFMFGAILRGMEMQLLTF